MLNVNSNKNILGIKIQEIEIQGLTKEQATNILKEKLNIQLDKEIKLKSEEFEYLIIPSEFEAKYNIEKATEEAYFEGRGKNIFVNNFEILKTMILGKNIKLEITYNEEKLDQIIQNVKSSLPNAIRQVEYYIEEEKLIITKGQEGNSINEEIVKKEILSQIELMKFNDINIKIVKMQPNNIDIKKISNEVCVEPQNAYYTKEPFQIFPEINGIKFDLEKALQILEKNKEEYEIPITIITPKITLKQIGTEAFPDLVSSFSTNYYANNFSRTKNLQLASNKINETVISPGEVFSYNKIVGERTIAKGYQEAPGYISGRVEDTLGGGICQISSTLYNTVLYANLEIIERKNHMFLTSYTTAGRDATVVYGAIDFKFKNTRKYPIMIKSFVSNGVAKMEIYGIKEDKEYEIAIETKILSSSGFKLIYENNSNLEPGKELIKQFGMNGCTSITYRVIKLNGVEVDRQVLSRDKYNAMNKIIQKGPEKPISPPEITPEAKPEPEIILDLKPEPENIPESINTTNITETPPEL